MSAYVHVCTIAKCILYRFGSADTSYVTATAQVPNRDAELKL